jgi:hypothetical protein
MPVPNTFGTATSAIPLSQLDANFATPITIGNTAVQLGNTVTTLNNMTLANVTISSGTITITNVAVTTANVSGTANVSTLVVVGNETVGGNTTITGNITAANANVTSNLVLFGGTANGVAYLNTSKQVTTGTALTFDGTTLTGTQATAAQISLNNSSGNYLFLTGAGGNSFIDNRISGGATTFRNGGAFTWSTYGGSDRMTLDASGNLLVGTTTATNKRLAALVANNDTVYYAESGSSFAGGHILAASATAAGTGWYHFVGQSSGPTNNILIFGNGNVQNANNSYGAISDAKLKENIVDATPKLEKLMQVRIRNYNLKGEYEQHKQIGVVAQELEQVFPSMVEESPDKDADGNDLGTVTKSVKYSVFVPMLIKAMQEQQAIITNLTARITALEGA